MDGSVRCEWYEKLERNSKDYEGFVHTYHGCQYWAFRSRAGHKSPHSLPTIYPRRWVRLLYLANLESSA